MAREAAAPGSPGSPGSAGARCSSKVKLFQGERHPGPCFLAGSGGNGQVREVLDVGRLHAVPPVTGNQENRQMAQQPRDQVDQDRLVAEEDGRPKGHPARAGPAQRAFHLALAGVVRIGRAIRQVGDADVHDPPHARAFAAAANRRPLSATAR